MWKDRSYKLLGLVTILCLVTPLAAQDLYTLKVDVPVISVDVAVTDSNGELVSELTQDDFQIFEDGALQEIRFFSPVSAPYNVFLLFDRSGSTRSKWSFMRNAVVRFIERLRPQDRIAMGSFDEKFDVHLRWGADLGKAIRALDEIVKPREVNGTRF
jgi:VWFA-related protein